MLSKTLLHIRLHGAYSEGGITFDRYHKVYNNKDPTEGRAVSIWGSRRCARRVGRSVLNEKDTGRDGRK